VSAQRIKPFQARWREFRPRLDAASGRQVDDLVAEVNALLAAILRNDEADAALLSARQGTARDQITGLHAGRRAGAAYSASSANVAPGMDWAQE
jgi:hypothetical protein